MANRPRRRNKKTTVSRPNTFTEDVVPETEPTENPDPEQKTYRNRPKKRKPFVPYMSLKKYKPKIDKYFQP